MRMSVDDPDQDDDNRLMYTGENIPLDERVEEFGRQERSKYTDLEPEILERLENISGKISEEHEHTRRRLERENRQLRYQLEQYSTSVPLPAYGAIIAGVIFGLVGIFMSDIIYISGGISILLVGLTAVFESKYRGKRIQ